jgi:hypothetical protein
MTTLKEILNILVEEINNAGPKLLTEVAVSEGLQYHIDNNLQLNENIYRPLSEQYFALFREARQLYNDGKLDLSSADKDLLETEIGEFASFKGKQVPLGYMFYKGELNEEEKKVQLNKPHRGGSKKFYVYVRDPKTKRIKKVSFGMAGGGLRAKLNNPKARRAFAKRQRCAQAKDRTTARYWSCSLPKHAKLLGFKTNFTGYW